MEVNLKTMYDHYKSYLISSNKRMKSLKQISASLGRSSAVPNQEGVFRFEDQQGISASQDFGKEVHELRAKVNSIRQELSTKSMAGTQLFSTNTEGPTHVLKH